jgi:NAD(P)-dependent dehydrogenase (short-subunit alcohol dehydrogenase family)
MADEILEKVGSQKFEQHASSYPLGIGSASSLIDPIIFALSPSPSWMAGSIITVDGGYTN